MRARRYGGKCDQLNPFASRLCTFRQYHNNALSFAITEWNELCYTGYDTLQMSNNSMKENILREFGDKTTWICLRKKFLDLKQVSIQHRMKTFASKIGIIEL